MTKIKKAMACLIAATTMAVSMGSMNVSALTWTTSVVDSVTVKSASTTSSLTGSTQSASLSYVSSNMRHTTGSQSAPVWSVEGVNVSTMSRRATAHVYLYNRGTLATSCSVYDYGDISPNSTVYASTSSTYSNLPKYYNLEYYVSICGGTSQYAPVVQKITLTEQLTK